MTVINAITFFNRLTALENTQPPILLTYLFQHSLYEVSTAAGKTKNRKTGSKTADSEEGITASSVLTKYSCT